MPRVNNASSVYQPSQIKRYFDQTLDQSRTPGRSRHVMAVNPLHPIFNSPTNNVTLVETYNEGVTLEQMPNQGSSSPFPVVESFGFKSRLYSGLRGTFMWIYFGFNPNPDAGGADQPSIDVYTSLDNGENWTDRGRIFESNSSLSSVSFVFDNWHLNFPTSNKTYTLQAFSTQNFETLSFPVAYPSASHQVQTFDQFRNSDYVRALYVRRNSNEYYYDYEVAANGSPAIYSNDLAFIDNKWVVLGIDSDKDKIHLSETVDQSTSFEGTSRTIEFKSSASENPGVFSSSQKVFYFKETDDWGVVVRIDSLDDFSYDVRIAVFKGTGIGFTWYNGNSIRNISSSSTISFSNDRQTGSLLMYINDEATGTHTFYALEENPSVGIDVGFVQKNEIVDPTVRFFLAENVSPTIVDTFNLITNPRFYQGLKGWQIRPEVTNGQKNYQWSYPTDATILLRNRVTVANEVKNLTPGNRYFYSLNLIGQFNNDSSARITHGGVLSSPTTVDNPFNATFGTLTSNAFGSQVAVSSTRHAGSAPTRNTSRGQVGLFDSNTNTLVHSNSFAISTLETNSSFGSSMDMCESYLIVGAPGSTVDGKADTGRAYIYSTVDGSLLFTLENPAPTTPAAFGDVFGSSVSICESYAIVGARNDYGNTNTTSTGRAYIFSTADGSLLYTLENPNTYSTGVQDFFGSAVAITESYAIVSAPSEDTENRSFTRIDQVGAAYIYSTATGQRIHNLVNPSPTANSRFGTALDISESYAVVVRGGNCYVYDPATGTLLYTLTNPNVNTASASDGFGTSVSITDRYLAIGAPNEDVGTNTNYNAGIAYVYDSSTGALRHTLVNPSAYSDSFLDVFGTSVAISEPDAAGTVKLIVGAPGEDQSGASESGKAYVYTISESNLLSQVTDFSPVENYFTATSDSIKLEISNVGGEVLLLGLSVTDITNINLDSTVAAIDLETASVNTVYTTSDFSNWTARTLPQTATWSWLARGKVNEQDLMLIGTNGEVCVSSNSGVSWSSASNLPALRVAGTWHQVTNVYQSIPGPGLFDPPTIESFWLAITRPTTGTTTQYAISNNLGVSWADLDFPVAAAWDYIDSYVYFDGTSTASQVMAHSNTSGTLLRNYNGGQPDSWSDITPATPLVSGANVKIEYLGTQFNGSSWEVGFVKFRPANNSFIEYSYSSDAGTTWTNSTSTILNANLNASNNLYYTYLAASNDIVMVQRSNTTFYSNGDFPTAGWNFTSNAFDSSPSFDFITTVDNRFVVAGGRSSQLYINPKNTNFWISMTGFPSGIKLIV